MHPAPSIIVFTTLSGIGFGQIFWWHMLGVFDKGDSPDILFGMAGQILAMIGLGASLFHLGNPQRAFRAFTQWRTSWLSREGWLACFALTAHSAAIAVWFFAQAVIPALSVLAALLALVTIFSTSMIYVSLKTVPHWNHPVNCIIFISFAIAGGSLFAVSGQIVCLLLIAAICVQILAWRIGEQQWVQFAATPESATGLGDIGQVRLFESPHTTPNYLMREMVFTIGRKHARKLRLIAVICLGVVPVLILVIWPEIPILGRILLMLVHLVGCFTSRWLFFAEARHVLGAYYGKR